MSSKRAIRRRSCTGKQRHGTAAEGHAHVHSLRRTKDCARMDVYQCPFCNGFHVGHAKAR